MKIKNLFNSRPTKMTDNDASKSRKPEAKSNEKKEKKNSKHSTDKRAITFSRKSASMIPQIKEDTQKNSKDDKSNLMYSVRHSQNSTQLHDAVSKSKRNLSLSSRASGTSKSSDASTKRGSIIRKKNRKKDKDDKTSSDSHVYDLKPTKNINLFTQTSVDDRTSSTSRSGLSHYASATYRRITKIQSRQTCHKCRRFISISNRRNSSVTQIFEENESEIEGPIPSEDLQMYQEDMMGQRNLFVFYIYSLVPTIDLMIDSTNRDSLDNEPISYVLRWNFLNFSDAIYFDIYNAECDLNVYKYYPFNMNNAFYINLMRCSMPIELFMVNEDREEEMIGHCEMKFTKALHAVNKIFEAQLDITNYDLCRCYPEIKANYFGYIICRYTFLGDQAKYDYFIPVTKTISRIPPIGDGGIGSLLNLSRHNTQEETNITYSFAKDRDSDVEAFQDGLNMVLIRNKALRTTQAEIASELKERTNWMHNELKWRLTLQENAILCGLDPNSVKWRQWKDEHTAQVKYRPLTNIDLEESNRAKFVITIVDLRLFKGTDVMKDDKITQIFVEYNFLGYTGINMETVSLPKCDDSLLVFRFSRKFYVHGNDKDARLVSDMIRNKESITFTVVSQPEEFPNDVKSCNEIGQCQVDLFKLIQSRTDEVTKYFIITDEYNPDIKIGQLKLHFSGVLGLRSLALKTLTPETFKIFK